MSSVLLGLKYKVYVIWINLKISSTRTGIDAQNKYVWVLIVT